MLELRWIFSMPFIKTLMREKKQPVFSGMEMEGNIADVPLSC